MLVDWWILVDIAITVALSSYPNAREVTVEGSEAGFARSCFPIELKSKTPGCFARKLVGILAEIDHVPSTEVA